MSESEEAFESADEDVDESKPKKRGRTTSEKLSDIKETESPVRDCKGKGDGPSPEVADAADTVQTTQNDGSIGKGTTAAADSDVKTSSEPNKDDAAETPPAKEMGVLERLAQVASRDDKSSPINWGFGKWGSSILSTAATSVSTFTNQVSQGIGTVIETVESTLGAPNPEELAQELEATKIEAQADDSSGQVTSDTDQSKAGQTEEKHDSPGVGGGIFSGVTAITKAIEATGSKVLSGGLDTLEMIGKKTMDILTEGDPGLRKKRGMFEGKTSLSEVLREAKMKAEKEAEERKAEEAEEVVNYSKLFDEHQGLVHLEALEMLCGERKTAVQQKLMEAGEEERAELNALLEKIKKTCESLPATDDTPDDELEQEFEKLVTGHLSEIGLNLRGEKLKETDLEVREWLRDCTEQQEKGEKVDAKEIYRRGIETLAEMTAKTMELYHKVAELLLVKSSPDRTPMHYATQLTGLTAVLCTEVAILSAQCGRCLNTAADDSEDPDSVTPLITNIYLEASNSNTYIQDGFQLLVPILQLLAVQQKLD
uniref:Protein FAM114A2 n=1 Tax=Hyalomma excavatum TaxID=257692 RepID=A0A131XC83_9ACAR